MHNQALQEAIDGVHNAKGKRFGVVTTRWNDDIIGMLRKSCLETLSVQSAGAVDEFVVPGAYELPLACKTMANGPRYNAIIAIGCVIRGDTPHFDYVAGEAARGITDVSLMSGVPVIFGVLTVNNREQAVSRADPAQDNKGREFALAAIEMANLVTSIKETSYG